MIQVLLLRLEELSNHATIFLSSQHGKKTHLVGEGEETTTPQTFMASNFRVPGVHVHQENTQFSTDQLMECELQMCEVAQKLMSTTLFSF
jgi:hypothetical protein